MKILLLVSFACLAHFAFCQDTTKVSTIEKIRELDNDVQELKDYVKNQKTTSAGDAKKMYEKNYNRLMSTSELLRELNLTIDLIENDKKQTSTYNKINQANNPSSDILGFKLTDVINTSIQETITQKGLKPEKAQLVKNIVGNLIYGLGTMFPPLQLVSSVISSVSAYTDKTVLLKPSNINNTDGKIKNVKDIKIDASTSSLDTAFIGAFSRKLGPYINFYVELNRINTSFDDDLSKFSFFYTDIKKNISKLTIEFESGTTIHLHSDSSIANQINKLMDYSMSGTNNFKHADYNRKGAVTCINENLEGLYEFVKYFNEYARQYIYLVNRNIDNNKAQLKNAKTLPKSDKTAIDNLLKEIEKEQIGTEQLPGFITKYNKNITSITNKIKDLKK